MKTVRNSFSTRLSLNIMLIVNLFFILSILIVAYSSDKIISQEARSAASNLLKANITEIEKGLEGIEKEVELISYEVKSNISNPKVMYDITRGFLIGDTTVVGSAVAFKSGYYDGVHFYSPYSFRDEKGEIQSTQLGNMSYDYFFLDWYQIPSLLGKPVWSEPYFDEGGGGRLMSTYSYPVKDESGEVVAIVTADISLQDIARRISEIKPYEHSMTLLMSRNGSFLSNLGDRSMEGETLFSFVIGQGDEDLFEICKHVVAGESGIEEFGKGAKKSFAVYGPLDNGWKACTICQYRDVSAQNARMSLILIIVALVGILVIFILCYFTIDRLTQPLTQFSDSARSIAHGNFETPLPEIRSEDEIRQLKDSFEYMQSSLTQYIDDLKRTTAANERMESELNIARQIQQDMLPHDFPHNDKIDINALLVPAKEVGGDLYDCFIKDNNLCFAIGDVSGKGVPAALVMAITKSATRFSSGLGLPMDRIMGQINNFVAAGNAMGMFVTMFIGKINLDTLELKYVNGGHNPIVIIDPDGTPRFNRVKPNLAIGLFEDFPYEMGTIQLSHGTRLLLYTDGVTEAEREDKEQYGEERLLEWCRRAVKESHHIQDAAECLFADVQKFTGNADQNDDITILTIKIG